MNVLQRQKIVLLGCTTRHPVAGVAWLVAQYLVGFRRLGYDVYYVEAHARPPYMFMPKEGEDGVVSAAGFIADLMRRLDLGDRWAYHALHADGRCYGLSASRLREIYRSAALLLNLHGGTEPLPEHSATGRLVYLETDPVAIGIGLADNDARTIALLEPHAAFFTWGLNYGNPDCRVPLVDRFVFKPSPPPVVMDFWRSDRDHSGDAFTTVGNWRQSRDLVFRGELYHWSKHHEFLKFLDLPRRTPQAFELALSKCDDDERRMLEGHGWRVRDALGLSIDLDTYHDYILGSRGEFTVSKDQNVRFRSGWFSERSATYLAAGRPVVTQQTGFSNVLPTGDGLFAFSTLEQILQAVDRINAAYDHHRRAARTIAHEYFSYDVVLPQLLQEAGLDRPNVPRRPPTLVVSHDPFPPSLVLTPVSRNPLMLPDSTVETVSAGRPAVDLARYDVIWVPPGDAARPQRLGAVLAHAARLRHRVFRVRTGAASGPASPEDLAARVLVPNLLEIETAAGGPPASVETLDALRRVHGIETAVLLVQEPRWHDAAAEARDRFGWPVVGDGVPPMGKTAAPGGRPDLALDLDALAGQGSAAEGWVSLDAAIRRTFRRASIVVVTFNGLVFTRLCLTSLLANTEYPHYEVIVVDNGSTDGTPEYLRELASRHPHVRPQFNDGNLGFAPATNQGLAAATGDVLVLLNNDTLVAHGWLARLVRHLADPPIGLVGPVTNRAGNEAQIETPYATHGELVQFARDHAAAHEGRRFDIRMLAMYCVAMRRDVYGRIGPLDEQFRLGLFEDEDYARRVQQAGLRVVCAEDVFVHHFGQASLGSLAGSEYGALFHENRQRFERKWQLVWTPYERRRTRPYQELTERIRSLVRASVRPGATLIVVSRGDEELLRLDGRHAWHFPQLPDGTYAGFYPADADAAVAQLEALRARGADYLLLPATGFWWLDHYVGFKHHLENRYRVVVREHDTCLIVALSEPRVAAG